MATENAIFALKIDADAEPAKEAAAELEKLRVGIEKGKGAIENYSKSLRLLKGSSDEVKDAKTKLKAAIEAERGKMTAQNLQILKLGGSYDKLSKATKKATVETDHGRKAISMVGGPVKDALEKFDSLKDLLGAAGTGWGALAAAVAIGVGALALAGAALGELTVKFTEWIATTADANRNLALTREAFSGSARNASAWGHIIDWASEKTALTTAQMNELVVATEKTYRGFRISGQGMVDAFKASALAAGAGRQDVAAFFDEIISRGKMTGRTFVFGPQDAARLRNAGIDIKALYKELGISAAGGARGAVVSTDKMAAALRKLSENRFAEINAKKMLSWGAQVDRLKDNFMRFTNDLIGDGGALEPLLGGIKQVGDLFDLSTESGQELKKSITEYGKALSKAIVDHIPDIKAFVKEAIHLVGAFIEGAAALARWAQSDTGLFVIKGVLAGIALAGAAIFVAFLPLILVGAAIVIAFVAAGLAIYGLYRAVKWVVGLDWGGIGKGIVDGIKNGLTAAWDGLKAAVTTMGEGIKNTFKKILGIASPSKVFAGYGAQSAAGYQQGIAGEGPGTAAATTGMASTAVASVATAAPAGAGAAGGGAAAGRSGPLVGSIMNVFQIGPGANAEQVKSALQSPSFIDGFQSSLRVLLQAAAIPTGAPVPSGG